jgi:hypothetical protein
MNPADVWRGGPYGVSLALNGVDNLFTVGDSPVLDIVDAGALMFWFKRPSTGTNIALGKWQSTQQSYLLQIFTDNKIYWNLSSTGSVNTFLTVTASFTETNNWHHIAAIYNGPTLAMAVYLDGAAAPGSITGTVPGSVFNSTTAFETRYSGGQYFNGLVSDIRLFNRALPLSTIQDIYTDPWAAFYPQWRPWMAPLTQFAGGDEGALWPILVESAA